MMILPWRSIVVAVGVSLVALNIGLNAAQTSVLKLPAANELTPEKKQLLSQVDAAWKTEATVLPARGVQGLGNPLKKQMAEGVLPSLEVAHVPLSAALESLTSQLPEGVHINFVVSGGNDPEVTLNLKNTTLLEALELMTEGAGMVYELRGNTVVIMPASNVGVLRTRYYPLSKSVVMRLVGAETAKAATNATESNPPALYQQASAEAAMKSFLERLGITWPEGSGMALADGELIVTHNARTLERIAELVERLARHRQVEIEAKFMEVGEGALDQLGVQWNLSNVSGNKKAGTTGVTSGALNSIRTLSGAFSSTSGSSGGATPPQIPTGVNLATNATANVDVTGGIVDGLKLRGIITALQQEDGTELLSSPRLTVLSGATASITVAQEMRYPQSYDRVNTDVGSGSSSGSILTAPTPLDFTTRNIGVQMQVTPYVEDDGSITLILAPEVTQFERFIDYGGQSVVVNGGTTQQVPSGFFQPVFSVRKLTTEVNIPSGSTLLLGGLTREESVTVRDKVPVLGNIPVLGRAFRSEGSSKIKKNLVVFVTARLVE